MQNTYKADNNNRQVSCYLYSFNNIYGLVLMQSIVDDNLGEFKISVCNKETRLYKNLNKTLQLLLLPLIRENTEFDYFIEYKSKEYIQIELAKNLIKLLYPIE